MQAGVFRWTFWSLSEKQRKKDEFEMLDTERKATEFGSLPAKKEHEWKQLKHWLRFGGEVVSFMLGTEACHSY